MTSVWGELIRRHVIRTAIAYVAGSWLVIQVAETLLPVFGFDNSNVRIVAISLAIGLVPVLILSWFFEMTPDGLKPDREARRDSQFERSIRMRLDRLIVTTLTLAVTFFAVDKFLIDPVRDRTREQAIEENARRAGQMEALSGLYGGKSIALLPFVNTGHDAEQIFFSDGISEDILTLLSKIEGIRVISSSTSFQFRDSDATDQEIARDLDVTYLLRGSVRRDDEMVRVSVRLIHAESNTAEWAENYDRVLDDIFAIQDDISSSVVRAIEPSISGPASRGHSQLGDGEKYTEYLEARYFYTRGREMSDVGLVRQAKEMYENLLRRHPGYAPAHSGLADVWGGLAVLGDIDVDTGYAESRAAAEHALELDDSLASAWLALADVLFEYDLDLRSASDAYRRALQLEPQSAEGLRSYAYFLHQLGDMTGAIDYYEDALAVAPLSFRAQFGRYTVHLYAGNFDIADNLLREIELQFPPGSWDGMWRFSFILRSQFSDAAELLPRELDTVFDIRDGAIIERWRGNLETSEAHIKRLLKTETHLPKYRMVASYYGLGGQNEIALQYLKQSLKQRELNPAESLWDPWLKDLRNDQRFWDLLQKAGMQLPDDV